MQTNLTIHLAKPVVEKALGDDRGWLMERSWIAHGEIIERSLRDHWFALTGEA